MYVCVCVSVDTEKRKFMIAFFTIAPNCKQPKCLDIEWGNQM